MLEHEIEPSVCTSVPGVRGKVVKSKLHAGTSDYVSGGIRGGPLYSLPVSYFIQSRLRKDAFVCILLLVSHLVETFTLC